MFDNIGGKIKILANVITAMGMIASIITGVYFMALSKTFVIGLLIAVVGSLISWVGSFVLYGFGEIIDLLSDIRDGNVSTPQTVEENKTADEKINVYSDNGESQTK